MIKAERIQLDKLVDRISKTSDLIYTSAGCTDICDCKMGMYTPFEKMEALIAQLDSLDIYLRYARFDQEASVRDLATLLKIIKKLQGETNGSR